MTCYSCYSYFKKIGFIINYIKNIKKPSQLSQLSQDIESYKVIFVRVCLNCNKNRYNCHKLELIFHFLL